MYLNAFTMDYMPIYSEIRTINIPKIVWNRGENGVELQLKTQNNMDWTS